MFSFLRIIFSILGIVALTFFLPMICAVRYDELEVIPSFAVPMIICLLITTAFLVAGRNKKTMLSVRGSFVIVALSWVCSSLLGAVPLYCSGCIPRFVDALFESVSGFSTTGSSIVNDIDSLPMSINLWRCETHWLGGMGIVVLTVALFPLLGVGGFQLIKAETTGPEKGKVTPKITTTAKVLWLIYIGMTVVETILLKLAGMNFFDALAHAFSTLGTGGFSTNGSSIIGYDSVAIEVIITVFTFFAGINFSLYFYLFARKFDDVRKNSELKAYIGILTGAIIFLTFFLIPYYGNLFTALRFSSFQVVTLITSTGFSTADYTYWPSTAQAIIMALFFIGGCSGSTGGGVKVVRWVIFWKQLQNEIKKMIHPHGVFSIQLDGRAGRKDIVFSVASFMMVYFGFAAVTVFMGTLANLDLFTAFTAGLSMVGNVGPAFGALSPSNNFYALPDFLKFWYMIAMLAGRLELYTIIIFFSRDYWKN